MDYFLFDPLTQAYLVSPVDSRTLKPASALKLSDFELKINGTLAENDEYIPVFQKIVGLPVQLHTALIVDTSSSTQSVEKTALINEIMQFVQKAQANSDPVIKNQLFSLWAFGDRKSTRLNSSHVRISYAVFCLKKKIALLRVSRVLRIMADVSFVPPVSVRNDVQGEVMLVSSMAFLGVTA